jgi:hypothetical protein
MVRKYTQTIFRVVYGSAYILAYLILLGLLLITPTDAIERSIRNNQRYNVIILIACYAITVITVVFAYAVRLYVNKTVLASIPKGWVPVDKGDVNKAVYKMIAGGLDRSAAIAYEAKPRVHQGDAERIVRRLKLGSEEKEVELPPPRTPWGEIEHPGWASPNSPDLPNLQYSTVLSELPNLIEARALTLAPPDPTSSADPPALDPEAVGLLQRAPHLSLRDYISHLAELGVLNLDAAAASFLQHYEHARFSNRPISMARFRELMHLFAEVLRNMHPLDLDALDDDDISIIPPSESDIDNNGPLGTDPSTPRRTPSRVSASSTSLRRGSSANPWYSAPNTPRRGTTAATPLSRKSSSSNSFAQTRHPYTVSSQASSASLRSAASAGSVIRLATREDADGRPFVLHLDG